MATTNFGTGLAREDVGSAIVPDEISTEIIQLIPEASVVGTRAKRVPMSKKKMKQSVLATLPDAYWVSEGGLKSTSKTGWEDVSITAEELAVIVPIPDTLVDDADVPLWEQIKPLIGEAFGKKIDQAALFGVDKPASWGQDVFAGATAAKNNIAEGTGVDFAQDVALLGEKVSQAGFSVDGFASQPGLNWKLTGLRDTTGRPVYTPAVSETSPSNLYGYPLNEVKNGAWDTSKASLLAADWTKFVYAVRQDLTYQVFDQGVISDSTGKVIYNLMQQDAKALRVVARIGFAVANPVTRVKAKGSQYPAGFITPAVAPGA